MTSRARTILRLGCGGHFVGLFDALLGLLESVEESIEHGRRPPQTVADMVLASRDALHRLDLELGDETEGEAAVKRFEEGR